MKQIVITRKKRFSGSLIKYYCVLNLSKKDFQKHVGMKESLSLGFKSRFLSESAQVFPIANGASISIELSEQENTLFVVAFTSAGRAFSNQITVYGDDPDSSYSIQTKIGLTTNGIILSEV